MTRVNLPQTPADTDRYLRGRLPTLFFSVRLAHAPSRLSSSTLSLRLDSTIAPRVLRTSTPRLLSRSPLLFMGCCARLRLALVYLTAFLSFTFSLHLVLASAPPSSPFNFRPAYFRSRAYFSLPEHPLSDDCRSRVCETSARS